MDIKNSLREHLQQWCFHQPHEPRQTDDVHCRRLELLRYGGLRRIWESCAIASTINHLSADTRLLSTFKNVGLWVIREHQHDLRIQRAMLNGIQDRLHVRARA